MSATASHPPRTTELAYMDPHPRKKCDHICLEPDGHDGPHFYGYELPSPRSRTEHYRAADRALRVIAGFLASRRRWRFVSVARAERELRKAVEPLGEALKR